ncbi:hypothetical protein G6F35_014073 [Rhizopus arrhizus]|nr:hypothetical protein G6F35_014073 [Rhizopus arrhizus]
MRAGHDRPVPGADGNRYRGPWRPASGDGQAAAATRRHGGAGLLRFFHAPALGLDRRADERAADRHGSLHAGQDVWPRRTGNVARHPRLDRGVSVDRQPAGRLDQRAPHFLIALHRPSQGGIFYITISYY